MSDDLIKRLLAEETDLTDCAVDRIEQLEKQCSVYARSDRLFVEEIKELEAKLAKAMEALRKIAAYTHSWTHEQGIVQNAEARVARAALAELEEEE